MYFLYSRKNTVIHILLILHVSSKFDMFFTSENLIKLLSNPQQAEKKKPEEYILDHLPYLIVILVMFILLLLFGALIAFLAKHAILNTQDN